MIRFLTDLIELAVLSLFVLSVLMFCLSFS